jgi:hypothetical protein
MWLRRIGLGNLPKFKQSVVWRVLSQLFLPLKPLLMTIVMLGRAGGWEQTNSISTIQGNTTKSALFWAGILSRQSLRELSGHMTQVLLRVLSQGHLQVL